MLEQIQIYHENGFPLEVPISLRQIVTRSIAKLLNQTLDTASILLELVPTPTHPHLNGNPIIVNLRPDFGYVKITVNQQDNLIYQHPHTIQEIVSMPLQEILRKAYPNESLFSFSLLKVPLTRPKPMVLGETSIVTDRNTSLLNIRPIKEPPLPKSSLEDFNILESSGDRSALVKIVLHENLHEQLISTRGVSKDVEEGGFLIGCVYEDVEFGGTYILEITHAEDAKFTGASLLHFTYTGDSFASIKQTLRDSFPGKRLLGWYHTHLFPATKDFGLSSIDITLHLSTFRLPWQVAGLINLDDDKHRTLRFYVRNLHVIELCPQWITLSRSQY